MYPDTPIFQPTMRRVLSLLCLAAVLFACKPDTAESQVVRGLANNTFAGTVNGALLGGATMALSNNDHFAPIRFGVGLGTLAGMGIGIYDASINPSGYVEGTFHTSSNSGYIILTDTFYGAAAGTVVGVAISLVGNKRVASGAQYGAGAGAWAGFTFGLADAFYLSYQTTGIDYFSSRQQNAGLIQWQPGSRSHIGFLNPSVYAFPESGPQTLSVKGRFGVELANVSYRF